MDAYIVTTNFLQTPDGNLWTTNRILDRSFWERYLSTYEKVRLIAQTTPLEYAGDEHYLVTGKQVLACPLPRIRNSLTLLRALPRIRTILTSTLNSKEAVHLRGPSLLCSIAYLMIERNRPFGIEIAGDPYDSLAPNAYSGRGRTLLRWFLSNSMRRICADATATAYVTDFALQKRYPPADGNFTTSFSSIVLTNDAISSKPRTYSETPNPIKLVHVGTQNQLYKGTETLIRTIAILEARKVPVKLSLIGDGAYRGYLTNLANQLRVGCIEFLGHLPSGKPVRDVLDQSDIFVLPSFQEGLPKAMIEAMARGLPCIGSRVGGIPELIDERFQMEPGQCEQLAYLIEKLAASTTLLNEQAIRNHERAKFYHIDGIIPRRETFYRQVKKATELYINKRRY